MAVYGISKEGADALKQLATDMSTLNNDIQECGQKLTAKVSGLGEGLGIYEEQIPVSYTHLTLPTNSLV